jgi:hypothetical protein
MRIRTASSRLIVPFETPLPLSLEDVEVRIFSARCFGV